LRPAVDQRRFAFGGRKLIGTWRQRAILRKTLSISPWRALSTGAYAGLPRLIVPVFESQSLGASGVQHGKDGLLVRFQLGLFGGVCQTLEALRSETGERLVLQNNYFIEEVLPNAILRTLSAEEMAEYRRRFAEPGEARRPTLTWPRQVPIDGEPADVAAIVKAYADWLATSNVPKLFLKAEPGAILANDNLVNLVRRWPALAPNPVGPSIIGSMRSLQRCRRVKSTPKSSASGRLRPVNRMRYVTSGPIPA
jgi:hypothetical protein